MKLVNIVLILSVSMTAVVAKGQSQNDFDRYVKERQQQFGNFRDARRSQFEEFRRKRNEEFAGYLRQQWQAVAPTPVTPKPKDETVPPVVKPQDEPIKEMPPTPVPFDEVIPAPVPSPQPNPIDPIEEIPAPSPVAPTPTQSFVFFGTPGKVRIADSSRIKINALTEDAIADCWLKLSSDKYTNLVYDCLKIRDNHNLSDWAYLMMLQQMSESIYGVDTNEATLLTAYVYCQSGYRMRLAFDNAKLYMLFASDHIIYDWNCCTLDGKYFYVLGNKKLNNIRISNNAYPKEKSMSLIVNKEQQFAMSPTTESKHRSLRNKEMEVTVVANKNMLDFYSSYPSSMVDGNFMSRWAMYANMPMPKHIKESVYPQIKKAIDGCDQWTAVNKILNFIQTGFEYEYDNKIWGYDRAFFPEESLHYPYCDCEDRSILLTRVVRDLLGLKCILIYYPGHLASAVAFTEGSPKGDYIECKGSRFFIADGTIIGYGASVGETMKSMDNKTAKVILLE